MKKLCHSRIWQDHISSIYAEANLSDIEYSFLLAIRKMYGIQELEHVHEMIHQVEKSGRIDEVPGGSEDGSMCEYDITNRELKNHIDKRFEALGSYVHSIEDENELLKRDLVVVLSTIAKQVEPEYFQWIYIILGAGSVKNAAKLLNISYTTFRSRLDKYTVKGGLYKTLFEMTNIRSGVGKGSIEQYNDNFEQHQPTLSSSSEAIRDLLDGLEQLNEKNWPKVRDELIELVEADLL